jgi:transposase
LLRGRDVQDFMEMKGGYTIQKDWLQPQRAAGLATAVRGFETPPGKQAQVDWGHLGYLKTGGEQVS